MSGEMLNIMNISQKYEFQTYRITYSVMVRFCVSALFSRKINISTRLLCQTRNEHALGKDTPF